MIEHKAKIIAVDQYLYITTEEAITHGDSSFHDSGFTRKIVMSNDPNLKNVYTIPEEFIKEYYEQGKIQDLIIKYIIDPDTADLAIQRLIPTILSRVYPTKQLVNEFTYDSQLKRITQLNQTQASLQDQLKVLRLFANKLGLYDAADYIKTKN